MCGLVGIAGDLSYSDETNMKRLLILDYFRGPHSTGLAAVAKAAVNPIDLFDMQKFKDALNYSKAKAFIGHNRLATQGQVNNINAHPFEVGSVVGAHNGTLETRDKWALEDAIGEKFDVDSHALIASIDMFGITETIDMLHEGRDSQKGAWALTWYDGDAKTLNFLRNRHRPLWYAWAKDFKRIFWASQWEMIDAMAKMSVIDLYVEDGTGYKFWQFESDQLYTLNIDEFKLGGTSPPKAKGKILKGKEPSSGTGGVDPFDRRSNTNSSNQNKTGFHMPGGVTTQISSTNTGSTSSNKGNSTTTSRGKTKPVQIIQLLGDETNPFAGWVPQEAHNQMSKFGCEWCRMPVNYGDKGQIIWERDEIILCRDCAGHEPSATDHANRVYVRGSLIDAMY
jgi:hypothetical protein